MIFDSFFLLRESAGNFEKNCETEKVGQRRSCGIFGELDPSLGSVSGSKYGGRTVGGPEKTFLGIRVGVVVF